MLLQGQAAASASPGAARRPPPPPSDDLYRYSLAVAEWARDVAGEDQLPLATYHLGNVHRRFGLEDRALELYRLAIELDPAAPGPYRRIGFLLSNRKNQMAEALDACQQSLLRDPLQNGVYARMGLILLHASHPRDAARAFEHEIRRGDASSDTYCFLGNARRQAGEHDAAAEAYRKALELEESKREAWYGLTRSLLAAGREEEAERANGRFEQIKAEIDRIEQENPVREDDEQDQRRHAAETWTDAHALLSAAVDGAPDAETERWLRDQAVRAVEESVRLDPAQPDGFSFLIEVARRANDKPRLGKVARRAAEALPENPRIQWECALVLLDVAPQTSPESPPPEVDEALRLLERTVTLDPDFLPAHRVLAETILFRARRATLLEKAREHAERALETAPESGDYDLTAMSHFYLGNIRAAVRVMREGVAKFPGDTGLRERLVKLEAMAR